jgi:hypothetical protein
MHPNLRSFLLISALALGTSLRAQTVLTINVSGSTVTFSATGQASASNLVGVDTREGFLLENFFPTSAPSSTGSTFTFAAPASPSTTFSVNGVTAHPLTVGSPDVNAGSWRDLLFHSTNIGTASFATTSPAFVGSMSFNFASSPTPSISVYKDFLPTVGTTGNVYTYAFDGVGDFIGTNIGTYSVVPEPSTYAAIAGLAGLLYAWYRRRMGAVKSSA